MRPTTMPARSTMLSLAELENELVVLDRETMQVHCLDDATRFVLEHCDGETPVADVSESLAAEHGKTEPFVWQALGAFSQKGLLSEPLAV